MGARWFEIYRRPILAPLSSTRLISSRLITEPNGTGNSFSLFQPLTTFWRARRAIGSLFAGAQQTKSHEGNVYISKGKSAAPTIRKMLCSSSAANSLILPVNRLAAYANFRAPPKSGQRDAHAKTHAADVNSEGNYRCEVVSEAPAFETVAKAKHLKVFGKFPATGID